MLTKKTVIWNPSTDHASYEFGNISVQTLNETGDIVAEHESIVKILMDAKDKLESLSKKMRILSNGLPLENKINDERFLIYLARIINHNLVLLSRVGYMSVSSGNPKTQDQNRA